MIRRTLVYLALAAATTTPAAAQPNPLVAARELYASARYDEALQMLNGLSGGGSDMNSPLERRYVEQYRSLCLLALGRGNEAEQAIAAVVTADPAYHPSEAEASPRVRTAFTDVRRRLLPDIARARYADAKGAFERKEFPQSEQQFRNLLALLDDPDMGGRLGDLRVLVQGFLDLSVASAPPPPPPSVEAPRVDEPPAPGPNPARAAVAGVSKSLDQPNLAREPRDSGRIFSGEDPTVRAPTAIKQELPRVPSTLVGRTRDRGLLELVIDEQGRVVNATIRSPIHPVYDTQLLVAAREWKYKPALVNGQPVKFRKMIQVAVTR
jgi:TonB family protein